jgi:hypothetical protein
MRQRIAALVVVALLAAYAWLAPGVRHRFLHAVITWDAPKTDPVELPAGIGPGLMPAPSVRVILIDGLSASTAHTLTTWSSLCKRGLDLEVDVGFPTVSLPVEVSLWTGLTQQQTGIVFRSDRPLVPPLARSIPRDVPGSVAVAENHGYIVRSIGFASALPPAGDTPVQDADAETWKTRWETAARDAVTGDARLVFVHVLRVDTWGHRRGRDSEEYNQAAREADAIVGRLYAAAPDARWFLLSDHGHLAEGGHGGDEREVRQVEHCIVGPGIEPRRGGLVHLVDISRALADSVGVTLDHASRARPMRVALQGPLEQDIAVPRLPLHRGALAIFAIALGIAASVWAVRRWWLAPLWFIVGCILLLLIRGQPTLSTPMLYAPEGRTMYLAWLGALPLATVATWFGLARLSLTRVLVAQLALPATALAANLIACGGWSAMLGAETAPVVPHFTAYTSPLLLITAHGSAAVALAVLARTVHSAFGRRRPAETPRSAPSGD